MKGLVLGFALVISSSAFAADQAAKMVSDTFTSGQEALGLKSTSARNQQLCDLVKSSADLESIGTGLLGQYANDQDTDGIKMFFKEMPSMAVTKLVSQAGNGQGAQITVDTTSTDNGDGTFGVGVNIQTTNGNSYDATIILDMVSNALKIMDGTYFGFSAVQYLGNDIQKQIGTEADTDPDHAITNFVKKQMADGNYISCD